MSRFKSLQKRTWAALDAETVLRASDEYSTHLTGPYIRVAASMVGRTFNHWEGRNYYFRRGTLETVKERTWHCAPALSGNSHGHTHAVYGPHHPDGGEYASLASFEDPIDNAMAAAAWDMYRVLRDLRALTSTVNCKPADEEYGKLCRLCGIAFTGEHCNRSGCPGVRIRAVMAKAVYVPRLTTPRRRTR